MVAQWQKHMPEDYRAIRDFLERRYPERWGKRIDVRQDIKQEVQGQVTQRYEFNNETIKAAYDALYRSDVSRDSPVD